MLHSVVRTGDGAGREVCTANVRDSISQTARFHTSITKTTIMHVGGSRVSLDGAGAHHWVLCAKMNN